MATSKVPRREVRGVYSDDLAGPRLEPNHGHVYMLVVLHRATIRAACLWVNRQRVTNSGQRRRRN